MESYVSTTQSIKTVGLVGPLPPPFGGMANQLVQLAGLLKQEGIDVHIVQVNAPYRPHWLGGIKGVRALARLFPYLQALWRTSGQVDVLHVLANSGWSWYLFAAPAIRIAKARGTPVIVNYRGGEAESFFEKSFSRVRKTLRFADSVIVPSAFLQTVFAKYNWDVDIVPNIIDLEKFTDGQSKNKTETIYVVIARNLEPIYDNASAIKAFKEFSSQIPNSCLLIAGTGPEEPALKRMVKDQGLAEKVEFLGRLDRDEMAKVYQKSLVMLNPSLADNMPNSVLEALAAGVVVVTTNVGGIPYLVEDGVTALLVEPRDYKGMSQAMLRVVQDVALRKALTENGQQFVAQFCWDNVRPRLFNTYARALKN